MPGKTNSVITTFRLNKEALEALNYLSERHRVPIKTVLHSAIDHLFELEDISIDLGNGEIEDLSYLAVGANLPKNKPFKEKTERRTNVVIKKTVINLNKLGVKYRSSLYDLINEAIIDSKRFSDYCDESTA